MPNLKVIINELLQSCIEMLFNARFVIAMPLFFSTTFLLHQGSPSPEYQLKAVFLFNFTQFIEWPANSFSFAQAPMVIGILGNDPFGSYLKETVSEEKSFGHQLLIQHYSNIEEVGACQVLFVNLAETKKTEQVITKLKGRNILTVSDSPDFLRLGGMIRFITKDNKIKLQINLGATDTANLVVSSKLLRLMEIFDPQKNN